MPYIALYLTFFINELYTYIIYRRDVIPMPRRVLGNWRLNTPSAWVVGCGLCVVRYGRRAPSIRQKNHLEKCRRKQGWDTSGTEQNRIQYARASGVEHNNARPPRRNRRRACRVVVAGTAGLAVLPPAFCLQPSPSVRWGLTPKLPSRRYRGCAGSRPNAEKERERGNRKKEKRKRVNAHE